MINSELMNELTCYFESRLNYLMFDSPQLDYLMIENLDIDSILDYYELTDVYESKLSKSNHQLSGCQTVKDLFSRYHYDEEDGYRSANARFEFRDGVHLTLDDNLSMIQAPTIDRIFEFSKPVLDYFALNVNDCKHLILSNQDRFISFWNIDGIINHSIQPIPVKEEDESYKDSYVKVISEMGIPRLVRRD